MMFIRVKGFVNMIYSYDVYMNIIVESSNCVHDVTLVFKLHINVLNLIN